MANSVGYTNLIKPNNDKLDVIQPDTGITLSTIDNNLEAVLDLARNSISGTTTTDGTEQTVYEESNTTPMIFNQGTIDTSLLEAGDTLRVRIYKKVKSGGSYILISDDTAWTFADVQDPPGKEIGEYYINYGFKITIELTAGTNRAIDCEFFDSKVG